MGLTKPDSERAVLASILVDPYDRETLSRLFVILRPEDFDDTRFAKIFSACEAVFKDGVAPDFVVVGDRLESSEELQVAGGRFELCKLYEEIPTNTNMLTYAQTVKEAAIRRRMKSLGKELTQEAENVETETADLAEKMRSELSNVMTATDGIRVTKLSDHIQSVLNFRYEANTLPFGFMRLDDVTTGMRPGQFIVIAGRPGTGKTTLALNIAANVARLGRRVLFESLEMSGDDLASRFLSSELNIPFDAIRRSQLASEQRRRILEFNKNPTPLSLCEKSTQTISEIVSTIRAQHLVTPLSLVVIDYIQLISVNNEENRATEIGNVTRALKCLAGDLKLPIIALSQLNRNSEREERRPKLADLRESGAIEQDADVVMFTYRPNAMSTDPIKASEAEIILAKQRNGPLDIIQSTFEGHFCRFRDPSSL